MMQTITEAINELMVIAVAQPEHLAIDVSYHAMTDYVRVSVLPRTFQITSATTNDEYAATQLFSLNEKLGSVNALKRLQSAKKALINLVENQSEVAA